MVDSHHFEQVVKVIWHETASLLQTDGSVIFARWRQRGHIGATWLIWLNLCFLRPTRVHNPNGKYWSVQPYLHSLRQKVPILYNGRPFPQKLPLPIGESEMASNTIPWAHPNPQPKHIMGRPFPPQNCRFPWGIWTSIQHMVPWAHPSPQPKRHLDWFSRFCRAH